MLPRTATFADIALTIGCLNPRRRGGSPAGLIGLPRDGKVMVKPLVAEVVPRLAVLEQHGVDQIAGGIRRHLPAEIDQEAADAARGACSRSVSDPPRALISSPGHGQGCCRRTPRRPCPAGSTWCGRGGAPHFVSNDVQKGRSRADSILWDTTTAGRMAWPLRDRRSAPKGTADEVQ